MNTTDTLSALRETVSQVSCRVWAHLSFSQLNLPIILFQISKSFSLLIQHIWPVILSLYLWSSDAFWFTWSFTTGPTLTGYSEHYFSAWDQTKLGLSEHQLQISWNLTILRWHSRVLCWHSTILCQSSQPCGTHSPITLLVPIYSKNSSRIFGTDLVRGHSVS